MKIIEKVREMKMLTDRSKLENLIEANTLNIIFNSDKCNKFYDLCFEQYNIPRGMTADLISMRRSLTETSIFVLFALLDCYEQVVNAPKSKLNKFFTDSEIKNYKKTKMPDATKVKFPLKIRAIQIADDQWIGRIDIDLLMQLRRTQMINYNENAQRAMQRVIHNDKEYFKIALNKQAVGQIEELLESLRYIPDDLTLNMPMEDEDLQFSYDDGTATLTIHNIKAFDIIDGYHRYVALSHQKDIDPEFKYTMEFRITNFDENKAQRFIFQKDQKTKMRKIDSNSYNVDNPGHIVVTKLNGNPSCNIHGMIGKKDEPIPFAEMVEWVDFLFLRKVPKSKQRIAIMETAKELTDNFNLLTEYNVKYLESKYTYKELIMILYTFYAYQGQDKTNMCKVIDLAVQEINENTNTIFRERKPRRGIINELEKILRKAETYV